MLKDFIEKIRKEKKDYEKITFYSYYYWGNKLSEDDDRE